MKKLKKFEDVFERKDHLEANDFQPIPETFVEESFDLFKEHFNNYKSKSIRMYQLHDPLTMHLGYVAMLDGGIIWHQLRMSTYKEWQSKKINLDK